MKNFLLTLFALLLFTSLLQAQNSKAKEKPPTSKEMEDMMKEMQSAMDDMDPEAKKMMDSMGIKLPDTKAIQKNVSGVGDAQLQKAFEDENRIVPVKDPARITAVLATNLSAGDLTAYINKTHQSVLGKLSAYAKTNGASVLKQTLLLKKSPANTAVGLWIAGKPTLALYVMGESCKTDPNAINLNNYASFLTMCGAEQLALPILNYLNKRYPKNSSILNNITQAWLGLGDIQKAEKYADSTIRIYASHPQANMAKCLIEESRGNIPAAIAAAKKAISKSYSSEKETKLKKLGYEIKGEDLNWERPMPKDAAGFSKFSWPDYPMDVEQNKALEKEWNDFKNECTQKLDELKNKQAKLEQEVAEANNKRTMEILTESQAGRYVQPMPGYTAKAVIKLSYLVKDEGGNMSFVFAKQMEAIIKAKKAAESDEDVLQQKQEAIDNKYEVGEGMANNFEAICKDENAIRNEFLVNANGKMKAANNGYFAYASRRSNELLYYYQYTLWPEQFELAKVNAEIAWLTQIKDQGVYFRDKSNWCNKVPLKNKPAGTLQNFDDVHCDYVSTMDLGVYKVTSSCSNLRGEFDFGGVKIDVNDNTESGRFSGSAMVGASKGIDGPAGTELEASVAALVEFDNSGITDVGAITGVTANVAGVTLAGADVKVTMNSGISRSGKSILQGIQ